MTKYPCPKLNDLINFQSSITSKNYFVNSLDILLGLKLDSSIEPSIEYTGLEGQESKLPW